MKGEHKADLIDETSLRAISRNGCKTSTTSTKRPHGDPVAIAPSRLPFLWGYLYRPRIPRLASQVAAPCVELRKRTVSMPGRVRMLPSDGDCVSSL